MKTYQTQTSVLASDSSPTHFRHFKLKPSGLLAMLFYVGFLATQNIHPAIAKETDDEINQPVMADEIVITATKTQNQISGVSATVNIINTADIQSIGAANLKDIFEKMPGVSLQYGTFPAASSASKSSVSIRGVGATGTLFLLDGRRLSGEVKNPYDLDRIPASMIERIEIIKGPMSVLYGADAIGGVVNIITKQPKEGFSGSIGAQSGTNFDGDASEFNLDAFVRGKSENLGYSLFANVLSTNPYTEREQTTTMIKTQNGLVPPSNHPNPIIQGIENNYNLDVSYREESTVYTAGGRLTYDLQPGTTIGGEFNYFTEDREGDYRSAFFPTGVSPAPGQRIPAFDTPVRSSDDNWRRDIGVDVRSDVLENLTANVRVYNSYYKKRNTTTALNWQDAGFPNEAASENLGMNANVDIWSYEAYAVFSPNENHRLIGGGEFRDETRTATVFNQAGTFETREVDYTAFYLQDEWKITNTLNATLGARYDVISNNDNKATFKVGLVNRFNDLLIVRGNFAQGYRAPDIRELYIRKNTPAGSQRGATVTDTALGKVPFDLTPEFINSFEIGASGRKSGFHYSAAVFYNDISDKIEQVTKNPGSPNAYFTFENISDAKTLGLELAAGYQFLSGIGLELSWFELDTENDQTGKDLEYNPERQISLTVNYLSGGLEIWTMGKYIGEQYSPSASDEFVDAYFLLDVGVNYTFDDMGGLKLYAGFNNILDEKLDKLIGSNVGTTVNAGVRYSF